LKSNINNFTNDKPREKCGIFGVYGKGFEAARLVHTGLWALQHRGQESSGIASSDGKQIYCHKKMGLVAHVYDETNLKKLPGFIAIGHNRYSTSGESIARHSQPIVIEKFNLALAHNGNLPNTTEIKKFLTEKKVTFAGLNDSEMMCRMIAFFLGKGLSLEEAVKKSFPFFTGVFCLLIMTKNKLVAVRDSFGIRPLSIGKLNGGFVFSSETCAFDTIGATYLRDVKPGEMVVVSDQKISSWQLSLGKQKLDIFEFIYFARPDSQLLGKSVYEVRKNLGRHLAREYKIKADVVVPVPDSAIPAALGFCEVTKIPLDHGLTKNRYIHRTFIRPAKSLREDGVEMKLNAMAGVLAGKKVIVIDDSIVRGTTSRRIVKKIRQAGAKEVHFFVSSPPVKFPDFYGIDTPSQGDLIGAMKNIEEVRRFIGADSLNYLSYKGMIKATGLSESLFSTSCFSGVYPVDIGERAREVSFEI